MRRSTDHIITSHAGTLPLPDDLQQLRGGPGFGSQPADPDAFYRRLPEAVKEVVRRQAAIGIDVVNDGEYGKIGGFSNYVRSRLEGLVQRDERPPARNITAREAKDFPRFTASGRGGFGRQMALAAAGPQASGQGAAAGGVNQPVFCTGALKYVGQAQAQIDIDNLRAAVQGLDVEPYLPAIAPGTIEHWLWNEHYPNDEAFLFAIADAMHEEYRLITDAGIVLQIDDPDLPDGWQIYPDMSVADYQKYAELRVEAINRALRGIPEELVRLHICWGSGHGPHKNDIPLRDIVDVVFKVKAECFSIEASNPRHDWEWTVFETFKLPAGKSLMPGVIGHVSDLIEHPELVAQRLVRYAKLVGRENVIAGTDCGIGSRVGHGEIAWAKLEAMVEGARIATKQLW